MYTFQRCDVVGKGSDGELNVALRGVYLCITHDAILIMQDTNTFPR